MLARRTMRREAARQSQIVGCFSAKMPCSHVSVPNRFYQCRIHKTVPLIDSVRAK
jgi:hypothetical protein